MLALWWDANCAYKAKYTPQRLQLQAFLAPTSHFRLECLGTNALQRTHPI